MTKSARIEGAVSNSIVPIKKAETCQILLDVSPATVEAVLGTMGKDGKIKRLGLGRGARYYKAQILSKKAFWDLFANFFPCGS